MDQFISTQGQCGAVLLIDCRTREASRVAFEDDDVVSNSNAEHALVGTEYSDHVRQCQDATRRSRSSTRRRSV